jgi:hypothetical protein
VDLNSPRKASTTTSESVPIETAHEDMIVSDIEVHDPGHVSHQPSYSMMHS